MNICPYAKHKNTFDDTYWCELTDSECECIDVCEYSDCEEYKEEENIEEDETDDDEEEEHEED